MFTVFANFFIDTEERFLRMTDSYGSFSTVAAERWVVNVRGAFAEDVHRYLSVRLGERYYPSSIESAGGWLQDSLMCARNIETAYVLCWLEDHICMCGSNTLSHVVAEMSRKKLALLMHSFWQNGVARDRYRGVELEKGDLLDFFIDDASTNRISQRNHGGSYIISLPSIMSADLFRKVLSVDNENPHNWPKATPFAFEKDPYQVQWLPLARAIPKFELFCPIDDDHGVPGTCLQARGLYPLRQSRDSYAWHR